MTSQELKSKLDASKEKLEKRLNNISKICKKLGASQEKVLDAYYKSLTKDMTYYPQSTSKETIDTLIPLKDTHTGNDELDDKNYDFNSKRRQLMDNLVALFDVERVVKGWEDKYNTQLNKENAPKIQVLVDFLNEWGELAFKFYRSQADELVKLYNEFHTIAYNYFKDNNITEDDYMHTTKEISNEFNEYMFNEYRVRRNYYFGRMIELRDYLIAKSSVPSFVEELSYIRFSNSKDWNCRGAEYDFAEGQYELRSFDEEKLHKYIEKDKEAKYNDLCERISAVVGEIEDVSQLRINAKGGLDGIVKGSKASAQVNTIGAGGYNIQCFHYRTLVNRIR